MGQQSSLHAKDIRSLLVPVKLKLEEGIFVGCWPLQVENRSDPVCEPVTWHPAAPP